MRSVAVSVVLHGALIAGVYGVTGKQYNGVTPPIYTVVYEAPKKNIQQQRLKRIDTPVPSGSSISSNVKISKDAPRESKTLTPTIFIPARPKSLTPPPYPPDAQDQGQTGTVHLRLQISETGHVTSAHVIKSSGYKALDDSAQSHAFTWEFTPGYQGDMAIPSQVDVPVPFEIIG